jgi:hypothetical protein
VIEERTSGAVGTGGAVGSAVGSGAGVSLAVGAAVGVTLGPSAGGAACSAASTAGASAQIMPTPAATAIHALLRAARNIPSEDTGGSSGRQSAGHLDGREARGG